VPCGTIPRWRLVLRARFATEENPERTPPRVDVLCHLVRVQRPMDSVDECSQRWEPIPGVGRSRDEFGDFAGDVVLTRTTSVKGGSHVAVPQLHGEHQRRPSHLQGEMCPDQTVAASEFDRSEGSIESDRPKGRANRAVWRAWFRPADCQVDPATIHEDNAAYMTVRAALELERPYLAESGQPVLELKRLRRLNQRVDVAPPVYPGWVRDRSVEPERPNAGVFQSELS